MMKPTEREFQGPLAPQLRSFAIIMERSGGSHAALFLILQRLDRFLANHYPNTSHLSREIVLEWFTSFAHLRSTSQSRYRTATFQFCKYLAREDPLTARYEDFSPVRSDRSFRPFIFSREQVVHLLEEARRQPAYRSPLRPWTLELIIGLLYSAGLRIGEVVRLDVRDYDRSQGTLLIRQTKFDNAAGPAVRILLSSDRCLPREAWRLRLRRKPRHSVGLAAYRIAPAACMPRFRAEGHHTADAAGEAETAQRANWSAHP